jgi:chaperone BCS1
MILKPYMDSILSGTPMLSCEKIPFISNKTFDTLFFDGKRELLARLEEFKTGTCPLVARMGMPQTLGLLFWGEPGTGKTSVIKAIANYMNRSLVQIPMNKIKTRKHLEEIMQGDWMTYSVPHDKRIYVLEEIDCSGWDDIVRDRRLPPLLTKEKEVVVLEDAGGKRALRAAAAAEAEKLTLGALLEILDGIVETPGRMVIMTTNHRDILDPALTRPGRIDMEIEFKKLRRTHIHQIYERMFGARLGAAKLQQIPDYALTQAELGQLLHRHSRDPEGFVSALAAHR